MNDGAALERIRIVLSRPQHPGNVGSAARALKTMGLSKLYLVAPAQFPAPQAQWLATGAKDLLDGAVVCKSLEQALAGTTLAVALTARVRDLSHPMLPLREVAATVVSEARAGEVALVFGNEMAGLTNAELDKCQLLATIPANPQYSSLNLAAAVQVVCYELRCATTGGPVAQPDPFPLATHEELEYFYQHLEESLFASGFLDLEEPKRLMRRLRRLFSRARLEKKEIDILRGILKAAHKKVE
jgi:tRNA/rRNA methyltransferase